MRLPGFLSALFEHGHVSVTGVSDPVTKLDQYGAGEILRAAEEIRRLEFPGDAPPWNAVAGMWAAEMFYCACQATVERQLDQATIAGALTSECPAATVTERHYSVDLVFQFLP